MFIDFSPVDNGETTIFDFAQSFTRDELRAATNTSIDTLLEIIKNKTDAQVVFLPHDAEANDPYAIVGEEHIGWSLAHLVAHVTATAEEGAAHSSVIARGIPYPAEPRLRYETHWKAITTQAECVQRLEESRRIRLAFLDTWPDQPHLDVFRETSQRYFERFGKVNAPVAFLFALKHEVGHYAQFREVARQSEQIAQA